MKNNWQTKKLSEVCNVDYGTRVVRSRNISGDFYVYGGGGKTFTSNEYNREDCVIVSRFAMSPYCVRKILGKFFLNDSGLSVSTKDTKVLLQDFVDKFLFASQDQIYSLGRGQAQRNLHIDEFKNLEIPLPPLEEQKKIVKILDEKMGKISEVKKLRTEALTDTEKILSQTLYEIFKEGRQKGWEEKEFGEVLEKIVGGGTPSKSIPSYWNGEIPWASVKDIKEGEYILKSTRDFITQEGLKNSSANLIPKGNIIISTRMGLGRVVKTEIDVSINQDLKALFPKKEIDVDFLIWLLLSKAQEIIIAGKGATVSGIRLEFLRKIKILLPSLAEQKKIVERLDALSLKIRQGIELQKSQLEDLKKLEKSYLREAFNNELK